MKTEIDVLGTDIAREMFEEIGRQAPFAQALTLTNLAKRTHEKKRAELDTIFTLRKAPFIKSTIRRTVALKSRLEASVYIDPDPKKDFLAKFEDGGPKQPRGTHIAVPLPDVKRSAKSGVIVAKMRPKALLENPKAKKIRTPNGVFIVLERNASKKQGLGRRTEFLYELRPRVMIRPELKLAATAYLVTEQEFEKFADAAIERALATAKK